MPAVPLRLLEPLSSPNKLAPSTCARTHQHISLIRSWDMGADYKARAHSSAQTSRLHHVKPLVATSPQNARWPHEFGTSILRTTKHARIWARRQPACALARQWALMPLFVRLDATFYLPATHTTITVNLASLPHALNTHGISQSLRARACQRQLLRVAPFGAPSFSPRPLNPWLVQEFISKIKNTSLS